MESAKRAKLAEVKPGPDFENRLFFQARNLAIEAMLLRISNGLLRQGFNVQCSWHESSYPHPDVTIKLVNPKPTANGWEEAHCSLTLRRETVSAPRHLSDCYYSVVSLKCHCNWGSRTPALVKKFSTAVEALFASGYLTEQVEKVNFPFDYHSYSSF